MAEFVLTAVAIVVCGVAMLWAYTLTIDRTQAQEELDEHLRRHHGDDQP
jgi:hypothetical protein